VSNGPVAKLKVTGVAARVSAAPRENRAAIIVSYDDHARRLFIRRCARYLWWKCISGHSASDVYYVYRWRVDISSKSPETNARASPTPTPIPHKSTPFESVTEKIRSDARPHIFYGRSILSLPDWGISFRRRASPDRHFYYSLFRITVQIFFQVKCTLLGLSFPLLSRLDDSNSLRRNVFIFHHVSCSRYYYFANAILFSHQFRKTPCNILTLKYLDSEISSRRGEAAERRR